MIDQQRTEGVILLYPSKDKTTKELRQSVSDFCIQNNIIPADVISPNDEYDYFAIKRLAQVLTRSTKSIKLVTNKDIISIIPILTLWAILDKMISTKPVDLMYDFLSELKDNSSKTDDQNIQEFSILGHKEVRHISDWLESMRCAVTRDTQACHGRQL